MSETLPVTLVIPCFNDGDYVRQSLGFLQESVEVIVVDDGSTDARTQQQLSTLGSASHITVVRQENQGPAAACRRGAQLARTPYVFFLGADDLVVPGALSALLRALQANDELSFAYGDFVSFGARQRYLASSDWDAWLMLQGNYCSAMLLVRRDDYLQVGGHPTRSSFEDWDLTLALANAGLKGRRLPRPVFYYRTHERNRGRRFESSKRGYKEEYRLLRRAYPELFAREGQLAASSSLSGGKRAAYKALLLARCYLPARFMDALINMGLLAGTHVHRAEVQQMRQLLRQAEMAP